MRLCVLLAALSLVPWQLGEEKKEKKAEAKPNALTAKEIADGWVLLFDGETTFGWKVEGEAKVEKGVLVLGGTKATTITSTTAFGRVEVRWTSRAATVQAAAASSSRCPGTEPDQAARPGRSAPARACGQGR